MSHGFSYSVLPRIVWGLMFELRGMTPSDVLEEYIHLTPLQWIEEPEDVAKVVGFLVGNDAAFITGEAINVTGGANL